MPKLTWPMIAPWVMLLGSNLFMTTAWYGHLKFKNVALPIVVVVSWMIAFFEYTLAVPANRIGSSYYSPAQLKTIQECITLTVFVAFSAVYLGQRITLSTIFGFALIFAGSAVVFLGR
ncbi:MAG: DMT family protein [Caulobacteraceae bacterium]